MIPIHRNRNHWTLILLDPIQHEIDFYDPKHKDGNEILEKVLEFIKELHQFYSLTFDRKQWKLKSHADIPYQTDGDSCGILTILAMECLSLKKPMDFTMNSVVEIRRKIKVVLAAEALLDPYIYDIPK